MADAKPILLFCEKMHTGKGRKKRMSSDFVVEKSVFHSLWAGRVTKAGPDTRSESSLLENFVSVTVVVLFSSLVPVWACPVFNFFTSTVSSPLDVVHEPDT